MITDAVREALIQERADYAAEIMAAAPARSNGYQVQYNDGEKYTGGLGPIPIVFTDYWALRQRSTAFFETNPYGRGLVRCLVRNIINVGLSLGAEPITGLTGQDEDEAIEWGTSIEDRWQAWGDLADACDYARTNTFDKFQRNAFREALIEGDVLVVEHHNAATQMPCYELINGGLVRTPIKSCELKNDRLVTHGVEQNARKEHTAYYVLQDDGSTKRIPARGRNGRRIAWMYYATDKRHDEVRGQPLMALVMQSVGEIDKYRDSAQRKATAGALLSVFFYQSADSKVPNSRPLTAGANRRVTGTTTLDDGTEYKANMAELTPGVAYDSLPPGVEPKAFSNDTTDEKFGEFEDAVLAGVAWALEFPVSVVKLMFDSSYSASRGEQKESELTIKMYRERFATALLRPAYRSWLVAMALTRRIEARQLLAAWRDPAQYEVYAAWTHSEWYGVVKEPVDLPKEVNGRAAMVDRGWSTNARASREMNGSRFESNINRVARENKKRAEALRPMLELEKEFGAESVSNAAASLSLVEAVNLNG